MFYMGIDIAKHKHEASIIDSDGKLLCESISFSNTQKGCEKLLALMQKFTVTADNCIIGMEATGHYWLSVYCYLLEHGYNLNVINPIQSDSFRKMYIRQTKNDSKDSFVIAQIMRFGQFSSTSLSSENIMALRQLSRYRLFLVDECSDCKRKVICLLDQVFPEYNKLFSDTFGVASSELLHKYPRLKICCLSVQPNSQTLSANAVTVDSEEKKHFRLKTLLQTLLVLNLLRMPLLFKSGKCLNRLISSKLS